MSSDGFWDKHDNTRTILLSEEDYEEYVNADECPETDNYYFGNYPDYVYIEDEMDEGDEMFLIVGIVTYDPITDEITIYG